MVVSGKRKPRTPFGVRGFRGIYIPNQLERVDCFERDFVLRGRGNTRGALRQVVEAVFRAGQEVIPDVERHREGLGEVILADRSEDIAGATGEAARTVFASVGIGMEVFTTSRQGDNLGELVLGVESRTVPGEAVVA